MAVTEIVKSGKKVWVHLAGTIAEVVQALADAGVSAGRLAFYTDGGTNAIALYCKTR